MSDAGVLLAIQELEGAVQDSLDLDWLAQWRSGFEAEKATAEHGPGWALIARRGHDLALALEGRVATLKADQAAIKREMTAQATGMRALQAYGSSTH